MPQSHRLQPLAKPDPRSAASVMWAARTDQAELVESAESAESARRACLRQRESPEAAGSAELAASVDQLAWGRSVAPAEQGKSVDPVALVE
jgi:hypothetical protein